MFNSKDWLNWWLGAATTLVIIIFLIFCYNVRDINLNNRTKLACLEAGKSYILNVEALEKRGIIVYECK